MAVDYYYSWDSHIGTFEIHHRDDDYWELYLDDDHIATSDSPESCAAMLANGEFDVDWGEDEPAEVPPLEDWAVVDL